jgi:hypothetical protein
MTHKKPPQGTTKIVSKHKEAIIDRAAREATNRLQAYLMIKNDPDWEDMKHDTQPNPETFKKLADKYDQKTVTMAWKCWTSIRRKGIA